MPRLNLARSIPNEGLELSLLNNDNNNNNESNKELQTTQQSGLESVSSLTNENEQQHSSASILQTYYSTHSQSSQSSPLHYHSRPSSALSIGSPTSIHSANEDNNSCHSSSNQITAVHFNEDNNSSNDNNKNDIILAPSLLPKKRRRTVNKIDKDPENLPLRDLLFYNPPETIFQKENRETYEEQNSISSEPRPAPVVKRRLSSRSNSISSDRSSNNKSDNVEQTVEKKNNDEDPKDKNMTDGEKDDDESTASSIQEEKPSTTDSGPSSGQVLTIDESGNIVFKNPEQVDSKDSVQKNTPIKMKSSTTYNSFRKRERTKNIWNAEETGIFYTALEIVGTDFSLMEAVFFKDRGRDRKQLKQKFKREEKINRAYIDEILFKSLHNRSKLKLATILKDGPLDTKTNDNKETVQSAVVLEPSVQV